MQSCNPRISQCAGEIHFCWERGLRYALRGYLNSNKEVSNHDATHDAFHSTRSGSTKANHLPCGVLSAKQSTKRQLRPRSPGQSKCRSCTLTAPRRPPEQPPSICFLYMWTFAWCRNILTSIACVLLSKLSKRLPSPLSFRLISPCGLLL